MTNGNMTTRLKAITSLIPELQSSLKSFQDSDSKFRILKTVDRLGDPKDPSRPPQLQSPKTLFILDSSFNPPSIAHQTLAKSVLAKSYANKFSGPYRMLLLFAVMNADKEPSPAAFEQRIAMMAVFAGDLLDSVMKDKSELHYPVEIDIGVTKAPYYIDKSKAIETEASEFYSRKPKHIHLVGFDTLSRLFAANYYKDFDPPFSALNPYFDAGHRLRVTLRPDDDYGSVEEQKAFVEKLANGEMDEDGGKKEWAELVELVDPNAQVGVSSTKIRNAAKAGDWETVKELCTPGVAAWVEEKELYEQDSTGAKMA